MKFNTEEIQSILSKQVKSPDVIDSVMKELEKLAEEKQEEKSENKLPKAKNSFAIVLLAETGELKDKVSTGYVVTYKDGQDSGTILTKLSEACRAQNESKRGKKNPITSITDAFAALKRKFVKQVDGGVGLNVKTKESVRVILSTNKLV